MAEGRLCASKQALRVLGWMSAGTWSSPECCFPMLARVGFGFVLSEALGPQ